MTTPDANTYIVENADEIISVLHGLRMARFDRVRDATQLSRIAASMRVIHAEARVIREREFTKTRNRFGRA
jgi:hypothetical protein